MRFQVFRKICFRVVIGDAVLLQERVDLKPGFESEQAPDLRLGQVSRSIAFDGEGLQSVATDPCLEPGGPGKYLLEG